MHEKWADEAQAWLLARDVGLKTLWLHELRYEGSPGFWHTILWVAQHIFHLKYASMGYLGAACAICGTAWLIFRSPFPRLIRWFAAFSYFFIYQYAVIARSYVLFPLFALIVVNRYRDRDRPLMFALAMVPLALLTAHGSLLAFGLGVAYAIRFTSAWSRHQERARRQFVYSVLGITILYLLLMLTLFPAKDTEATHNAAFTGQLIASRAMDGLSGSLVDNRWLSVSILAIFAVWCYSRHALIALLLPVALLTAVYVYVAWPHQQGTIFLSILCALAIAWPTGPDQRRFTSGERFGYTAVAAILVSVLVYQTYVGIVVIRNDARLPYCGAQEAAQYLKPIVDEHDVIYGYQYGMVAINAYFPRNIFANWRHAYYHHAVGEFDPTRIGPEIATGKPDFVVTTWWENFNPAVFRSKQLIPMENLGYSLVHLSDGYLLTKTGYSQRQIYAIFKRNSGR